MNIKEGKKMKNALPQAINLKIKVWTLPFTQRAKLSALTISGRVRATPSGLDHFYKPSGYRSGVVEGKSEKVLYAMYGLGQCWNIMTAIHCGRCVSAAGQELRVLCPYIRGAIIWYENCLLKYSDTHFIGISDTDNVVRLTNIRFIGTPLLFGKKVHELLTHLCSKASVNLLMYLYGKL
ncbi:hypothetical protein PRUPE_1G551300 [Prunus persica]|uniref:Gnk2-homologous domain-containing protein n=1 Tax=Prunus persica TaxID=3760 RepID=A0A251RI23_PRUPE|nr:hypothetical protein PRUPE_1G551300 [Prunus persica]